MPPETDGPPIRTETLYAVIGAIADGPDLERVLTAIVEVLAAATDCHACFVYLREGDRLRMRAASPVFSHAVDRVVLGMDEGLTGWVARNRAPAFIREGALDDPRMKYVPELKEEHFQSMVAVPLIDRHGDVIGVVVLHTQAPREFDQDVLDLLVHVASLVAGAIDNARLYDQTRQQVAALSALSALSQEFASISNREELYEAGCSGILRLLAADRSQLAIFDAQAALVEVAESVGHRSGDSPASPHAPAGSWRTAQLGEGAHPLGVVRLARKRAFTDDDARLLQTATNQLALAIRTVERIEQLAAENVVRQVFDALERRKPAIAASRAAAAGWDDVQAHVAVFAVPAMGAAARWDEQTSLEVRERIHQLSGRALLEPGTERLRSLVPIPVSGEQAAGSATKLRKELAAVAPALGVAFGISRTRDAFSDDGAIFTEAADAANLARAMNPRGGAQAYDELGPYRFLVPLLGSAPPDATHAQALQTLAKYDRRRGAAMIETLDVYLDARGAVRAAAEQLVIHPNTLRQRIERIEDLTKLRLENEDLLSLQLSVKLYRLHHPPVELELESSPAVCAAIRR